MEFDTEWVTLGTYRLKLRSTRGFPSETLHKMADVARLAIESNMSARARLVEIVFRDEEKAYDLSVGTTLVKDTLCAPQLEAAIATVLGLPPEKVNITVVVVSQEEVNLHFGVYERMLAEKLGAVPPIQ